MRLGEPLPDSIANVPELPSGMDFYIDAFFDLCSERYVGFDEGAIPTTAILRYATHYGMDSEDESDFLFFIRRLDEAYLEHKRSKQSKKK